MHTLLQLHGVALLGESALEANRGITVLTESWSLLGPPVLDPGLDLVSLFSPSRFRTWFRPDFVQDLVYPGSDLVRTWFTTWLDHESWLLIGTYALDLVTTLEDMVLIWTLNGDGASYETKIDQV
ncbi:hypothetical protein WMY93_028997 [Mugilogobius chulae]|uniref:Uncharacterized protein n=1 Tax=Mugilogobius chulae TaxID=88201 RepID=A0AAW0MWM9_9GOBI